MDDGDDQKPFIDIARLGGFLWGKPQKPHGPAAIETSKINSGTSSITRREMISLWR